MTASPRQIFTLDYPSAGELAPGLCEIAKGREDRLADGGIRVTFQQEGGLRGFRLMAKEDAVAISYGQPCHAYRALGVLLSGDALPDGGTLTETTPLTDLGVMLDVSRNALWRPEAARLLFQRLALMGYNSVQLYMEDTYVLAGEPFFGYARGPYTEEELRRIDDYGALLGIEVIPCIQTLGHLHHVLKWPAYAEYRDVPDVLLVGDEKVNALIRKMLETLSRCFRSRRIHIGMDEAHGVGQGRYRQLHGDRRPFDILNEHLATISGMCHELGLEPMMWCDMYFRMASPTGDYYDLAAHIPTDVAAAIPRDVALVYWDYYHRDTAFYEELLGRLAALGHPPILAAGGWTWGRFWTDYPTAFATIAAGMRAAHAQHLREAFITMWGDDGNECDPFSMLPVFQFFAECAYDPLADSARVARRFPGSCGCDAAPLLLAGQLETFPDGTENTEQTNYGKWILWHDPVLGFFSDNIPAGMDAHYAALADQLAAYPLAPESADHQKFALTLVRALAAKARLHLRLKSALRSGDRETLRTLAEQTLPTLREHVTQLRDLHRAIWHRTYKHFGWENLDVRYAGLLARLETLSRLLDTHLSSARTPITEFAFESHPLPPPHYYNYAQSSGTNGHAAL